MRFLSRGSLLLLFEELYTRGRGTATDLICGASLPPVAPGNVRFTSRGRRSLAYDLDILLQHCVDLGFPCHRSSIETLAVTVMEDAVLVFTNRKDESDPLIGFAGTPWHSHGTVILMTGQGSFAEFTEYELLSALRVGDVVIVERFLSEQLVDRWIAHKHEALDVKYIEVHEELRVRRLP